PPPRPYAILPCAARPCRHELGSHRLRQLFGLRRRWGTRRPCAAPVSIGPPMKRAAASPSHHRREPSSLTAPPTTKDDEGGGDGGSGDDRGWRRRGTGRSLR